MEYRNTSSSTATKLATLSILNNDILTTPFSTRKCTVLQQEHFSAIKKLYTRNMVILYIVYCCYIIAISSKDFLKFTAYLYICSVIVFARTYYNVWTIFDAGLKRMTLINNSHINPAESSFTSVFAGFSLAWVLRL